VSEQLVASQGLGSMDLFIYLVNSVELVSVIVLTSELRIKAHVIFCSHFCIKLVISVTMNRTE
jgi:hypothetical protein